MSKRIIRYLKSPRLVVDYLFRRLFSKRMSDIDYIKCLYFIRSGKKLNLDNPMTFNEKLSWLKIYNRKPEYALMADKYAVKEYVAGIIGKEYVVENYFVADYWSDIDFSKLPEEFVIKCTHDSGGAIVCRNKCTFDFKAARKRIENHLRINYFYEEREWVYKNIRPRIIIDRLLDDHTGNELRDYKFWCFDGKPTYAYFTIKGENVYENFYDMDFNVVNINHGFPRHKPEFVRPANFELMKKLAAKLSKGIPFVRVDFFDVDGCVYFGEYTFYDWGGMVPFPDYETDLHLGELIKLPVVS